MVVDNVQNIKVSVIIPVYNAEKYLANNAPEKDLDLILNAERNIRKINPKNWC